MAAPLSDATLLRILKSELGGKLRPVSGWQGHNRNPRGAWGPINGVMVHHTGGTTSGNGESYNRNVLWSGYAGLPGPLCHFGVAPDGTVWLNSNGRANHAGGGDPAVLAKVVAESYSSLKPTRGNSNGVDGNRHFYGIEVMYSGSTAMSAAQRDSTIKICAAIEREYGWSSKSTIGHGEWSSDKWDPGSCDMNSLRADVQRQIDSASQTTPEPLDPMEEIMGFYKNKAEFEAALREAVRHNTVRAEMNSYTDIDRTARVEENLAAATRRGHAIGRQTREKVNRIEGKLDGLIKALKAANIDIDLDAIAAAAREGAAQGAADVTAEDVAARLEVGVK